LSEVHSPITDFSRTEWETVASGETNLSLSGNIVYSDIFGVRWSYSFDWRYSPALDRLIPDNQPRQKTT
jgi:hypothetical protein